MSLVIPQASRIADGSFADIFPGTKPDRVIKLFRAKQTKRTTDAVREICRSEIAAHELIREHPELARHTPIFYGQVTVSGILDRDQREVSGFYVEDACYEMERVDGPECKLGELSTESHPHVWPIVAALEEIGVGYIMDASVLSFDDPEGFKVIDFATFDGLARYWEWFKADATGT